MALKSFLPTIIGRQKVQLLKKRYSAGFGFPKVSLVIKLFNQKCRKKIHKTRLVSESQAGAAPVSLQSAVKQEKLILQTH